MIRVIGLEVRVGQRPAMTVVRADEGAGPYLLVSDGDGREIGIDPEEWPELRRAINAQMRRLAREGEGGTR